MYERLANVVINCPQRFYNLSRYSWILDVDHQYHCTCKCGSKQREHQVFTLHCEQWWSSWFRYKQSISIKPLHNTGLHSFHSQWSYGKKNAIELRYHAGYPKTPLCFGVFLLLHPSSKLQQTIYFLKVELNITKTCLFEDKRCVRNIAMDFQKYIFHKIAFRSS